MIDSHCHVFAEYYPEPAQVIADCLSGGLEGLLLVGIDLANSQEALALAATNPRVGATVGFHPHETPHFEGEKTLTALRGLLAQPGALALGEIGLDYFKGYADPADQRRVTAQLLPLAKEADKPVVFHCRDAYGDLWDMAQGEGLNRGIVHCFTGQYDEAKRFVDLGFYVSFSGILTYKSARHLKDVARRLPLDRILIETDAPYLAPQPVRGKPNHPTYLRYTFQELAEAVAVPPQALEEQLALNMQNAIGFRPGQA